MMLVHIGQNDVAERVHNAFLRTIEEGIHTYDIYKPEVSTRKVGTRDFGKAIVARLGQLPQKLKPVHYKAAGSSLKTGWTPRPPAEKKMVGVDVFLDWRMGTPDELAGALQQVHCDGLTLKMITNRGVKVWPGGVPETFCTDHWRCRFMAPDGSFASHRQIVSLLGQIEATGLDFIKTEHLCTFDGELGFSLGQGQ
jgi:isocitrate dehydrogenase